MDTKPQFCDGCRTQISFSCGQISLWLYLIIFLECFSEGFVSGLCWMYKIRNLYISFFLMLCLTCPFSLSVPLPPLYPFIYCGCVFGIPKPRSLLPPRAVALYKRTAWRERCWGIGSRWHSITGHVRLWMHCWMGRCSYAESGPHFLTPRWGALLPEGIHSPKHSAWGEWHTERCEQPGLIS